MKYDSFAIILIRLNWFLYSINLFQYVTVVLVFRTFLCNIFLVLADFIQPVVIYSSQIKFFFSIIISFSGAYSSTKFNEIGITLIGNIVDRMFHLYSSNLVFIISTVLSVIERLLILNGSSGFWLFFSVVNTNTCRWFEIWEFITLVIKFLPLTKQFTAFHCWCRIHVYTVWRPSWNMGKQTLVCQC